MHLRRGRRLVMGKAEIDMDHADVGKRVPHRRGFRSAGLQIDAPLRGGIDRSTRRCSHGSSLAAGVVRCRCSAWTSSRVRPVLAAITRST